jgi:pimeloyl-ACP methyl ester carboxylesterase
MDNVFIKEADLHAGFTDSISEQDLIEYSQLLFTSKKTKERHNFFADFKSVKDNFRSKMFTSVVDGKISKEIDLLRRTHLPLLIIFGENEKICIKTYLDNSGLYLWKEQTFQIKDAGHFAHIDQPESINKLISEYADEIFNTI